MLTLILTILKIIGISILVILGITICLLIIIMFVPIRYKSNGTYHDSIAHIEARITWLLHAVTAIVSYENKNPMHICIKIFGITVFDNLRPVKEKNRNKKDKKTKTKSKTKENDIENTGEIQAASQENIESVTAKESFEKILLSETDVKENIATSNNFFDKIKMLWTKFINILRNIKFTYHKMCDTMRTIKNNIKYYCWLLQLDSTKQAFSVCKKQVIRVLKKISPKKYRVWVHIGFDDPSVTGNILAIWGMFYPLHNGNIDIQPEFEQIVTEGEFYLKGHISIFAFVQAVFIILFDKNIKMFIKRLKRNI